MELDPKKKVAWIYSQIFITFLINAKLNFELLLLLKVGIIQLECSFLI